MRICFIGRGKPENFFTAGQLPEADVYCFSFSCLEEINYGKELSGETEILERLTLFSKKVGKVIICGCYTDLYGLKQKSAAVADRGRLLGIADRNNNFSDSGFSGGVGLKIFNTRCGKIGVAVGEDLFFPEVIKSLSLCGSDAVMGIIEKWNSDVEYSSVKANAYAYGISIAVSSPDYSFGVNSSGKTVFSTANNLFSGELPSEREYRLYGVKRRGFSCK